MSEVKWIKIVTDIFDDEKMFAIETKQDGYTIELVWFKLLCLAGKCNKEGFLMVNKKIPYTDEMLSKVFRMDVGIVQRALTLFQELEMIEVVENTYMIANWQKYQNQKGLEELRQKARLRQQKCRAKQKELLESDTLSRDVSRDVTRDVTSQRDVICSYSLSNSNSLSNNNLDNKELKDTEIDNSDKSNKDKYKDSINKIVDYLNLRAGTNYKPSTKKTQTLIIARIKEGNTVDDFKTVIDKKCNEWMGTEHEKYLRPETLFGTKFEGYLNQHIIVDKPTTKGEIDWDNV